MHRNKILRGALVALVLAMTTATGLAHPAEMIRANYVGPPSKESAADGQIPDLQSLLNVPFPVQIENLAGAARDDTVRRLVDERTEAGMLEAELAAKGFTLDRTLAEAMRVSLCNRLYLPVVLKAYSGEAAGVAPLLGGGGLELAQEHVDGPCAIHIVVVPATPPPESTEGLAAFLVAMLADDGTTFYQAHHTNLDPHLAQAPDPPIVMNNMPYFYVTTLQVIHGRIVPWHYWWFDSHHHPNWYYACYQHYWSYYHHGGLRWSAWHHWAYGWVYWRFWYYWSTWFPWAPQGP